MFRSFKIIFLIVACLTVASCRKVTEVDMVYVGNWDGNGCPGTSLNIYEDSHGCFIEHNPNIRAEGCQYTQCGTVKVGSLYVYIGAVGFKIKEKPHFIDKPVIFHGPAYGSYSGYYEMKLQKPFYVDGKGETVTFRKYTF